MKIHLPRAAAAGCILVLACLVPAPPAAAQHRFGGGLHYWQTLDDLADDFDLDENGAAWVLSYQYAPEGLFKGELALEYFGGGFGGSDSSALSPLAYVLVGGDGLYGGIGVGITFSDGLEDNVSEPFFAGRFGYDFALVPKVRLDVNVNYRVQTFEELDNFDTDVMTLGAVVRWAP